METTDTTTIISWTIFIALIVLFLIYQLFFKNKPTPVFEADAAEELSASQQLRPSELTQHALETLDMLQEKGVISSGMNAKASAVLPVSEETLIATGNEPKQIVESLADLDPVVAAEPTEPEPAPAVDATNSSPHKGAAVGKFSDAIIRAIRADTRSDEEIAAERGVTARTIKRIRDYDTYAHVR